MSDLQRTLDTARQTIADLLRPLRDAIAEANTARAEAGGRMERARAALVEAKAGAGGDTNALRAALQEGEQDEGLAGDVLAAARRTFADQAGAILECQGRLSIEGSSLAEQQLATFLEDATGVLAPIARRAASLSPLLGSAGRRVIDPLLAAALALGIDLSGDESLPSEARVIAEVAQVQSELRAMLHESYDARRAADLHQYQSRPKQGARA